MVMAQYTHDTRQGVQKNEDYKPVTLFVSGTIMILLSFFSNFVLFYSKNGNVIGLLCKRAIF